MCVYTLSVHVCVGAFVSLYLQLSGLCQLCLGVVWAKSIHLKKPEQPLPLCYILCLSQQYWKSIYSYILCNAKAFNNIYIYFFYCPRFSTYRSDNKYACLYFIGVLWLRHKRLPGTAKCELQVGRAAAQCKGNSKCCRNMKQATTWLFIIMFNLQWIYAKVSATNTKCNN